MFCMIKDPKNPVGPSPPQIISNRKPLLSQFGLAHSRHFRHSGMYPKQIPFLWLEEYSSSKYAMQWDLGMQTPFFATWGRFNFMTSHQSPVNGHLFNPNPHQAASKKAFSIKVTLTESCHRSTDSSRQHPWKVEAKSSGQYSHDSLMSFYVLYF